MKKDVKERDLLPCIIVNSGWDHDELIKFGSRLKS